MDRLIVQKTGRYSSLLPAELHSNIQDKVPAVLALEAKSQRMEYDLDEMEARDFLSEHIGQGDGDKFITRVSIRGSLEVI
jgi:hypothetical protein